jgi:16S rRNA (cytosine1402-N4)-methyltransferase
MTYHTPVLLPQVTSGLRIQSGHWYIDATIGGGGYAVEILKNGGKVLGIDTDSEAIDYTRNRIHSQLPTSIEDKDWKVVQENFRNIEKVVANAGIGDIAGVLFDLGVSSHQLDTAGRGMSFRYPNEPFDLRLNQKKGETAAELVNRLSKEELYEIIARYGEEERAFAIADAFLGARSVRPIKTIGDVISVIESIKTSNQKQEI